MTETPSPAPRPQPAPKPAAKADAPKVSPESMQAAAAANAPIAAYGEPEQSADEREEALSRTEGEEEEENEEEMVYVTSGRDDDLTVLWEQNPQHPDGEIFIGPDVVSKGARTSAVMGKITSGEAVEVDKAAFDEYVANRKEEDAERRQAQREQGPFVSPFATPPPREEKK